MTGLQMRRRTTAAWFVLLCAVTLLLNLPIIVIVVNSFQTTEDMIASVGLIPRALTFANYLYLSGRTAFWTFFGNSLLVAIASTVLTVTAATLAGYALSRFKGRILTGYSRGLLFVQMFPLIVALIPLFVLFRGFGLINSPASVILIYTVVHLPFATWMSQAYFDTIPRELEEAASVDGCTQLATLWRIVLPLAGPGVAAVTIFSVLFSFNEFFVASVFLRDDDAMTIPVGIQMFVQQYSADWGSLMAAATLTALPAFLFLLVAQKQLAQGATAGGVKG